SPYLAYKKKWNELYQAELKLQEMLQSMGAAVRTIDRGWGEISTGGRQLEMVQNQPNLEAYSAMRNEGRGGWLGVSKIERAQLEQEVEAGRKTASEVNSK